jgi:hypothetical protein
MIAKVFTVLAILQFLFMGLHDLVDIPGWAHGRQVREAIGPAKAVIGTLVNSIFPGLAAGLGIYYWNTPNKPASVLNYWLVYCAITIIGATTSWWIPYFRGTDQKTKDLYAKMYAGTIQVLPPHGDNPRPNLLHLYFHALGLTNLILATILWFKIG